MRLWRQRLQQIAEVVDGSRLVLVVGGDGLAAGLEGPRVLVGLEGHQQALKRLKRTQNVSMTLNCFSREMASYLVLRNPLVLVSSHLLAVPSHS